MLEQEIILRQKLKTGGTVNVMFDYLRQHYKQLFKAVLVISGPIVLVGSIFIGSFYYNIFQNINNPAAVFASMGRMMMGFFLSFIGMIVMHGIVVEYFKLSMTKNKNEISLQDIFGGLKKRFWQYLFASLIIIALTSVSAIFLYIPAIYFMVVFSVFFMIIGIEEVQSGDAFTKCFSLIKGNWWKSFAVLFLAGIIQLAVSYLLLVPVFVVSFLTGSGAIEENAKEAIPLMFSILTPLSFLVSMLLYIIPMVSAGVNYFSLVEQKEEVGLKKRIEGIYPEKDKL